MSDKQIRIMFNQEYPQDRLERFLDVVCQMLADLDLSAVSFLEDSECKETEGDGQT